MQTALFDDASIGWCHGPLFNIRKRRPARKELFKTGWMRRQCEYARTPAWADRKAVAAIYAECKALNRRDGPRTWVVDHEIPLNHPLVCGLHVANNLRIVPYEVNQRKSNHWPVDVQMELWR